MSFATLLNVTVSIQKFVATQTNSGSITKAWSTSSSPKGRIVKQGLSEQKNAIGLFKDASHILYLNQSANIVSKDRVVSGGVTYEVLAVQSDSSLHHKEIALNQVIETHGI